MNKTGQIGLSALILALAALFIWNKQRSPQSCESGETETHVCAVVNASTNPDAKPQWLKKCEVNADCTEQPGLCVRNKDMKYGVCLHRD